MNAGSGGGEADARPGRAPEEEGSGARILADYGSAFRMGGFDWDLLTGTMTMDDAALDVFDMDRADYDGRPESLSPRVLPDEGRQLDTLVAQALKDGSDQYGAYFRIRRRDGSHQWTHTQGLVHRDGTGRPVRIIGILRDATHELTESAARLGLDEGRRQRAGVVEGTTAALAYARTVQDVVDLLNDSHALEHFGAASLVMGLLDSGRIRLVAEGPDGSFVPGTRFTRVDEPYPMSEVIRTLRPASSTRPGTSPTPSPCSGPTSADSASPPPPTSRSSPRPGPSAP
ncbi:PAS domain-containing protein [Streptomyces diastatochromogenes]|nr:PAS domain-containing protein [Streptomyces diastatochromogenes]